MVAVLVVLFIIAIVIGLWILLTYNGFIRKRQMLQNTFSAVDVNLQRRHDLIPNLVETVKAYASHEKETLTAVTQLRTQAMTPGFSPERLAAEEQLTPQIGRLLLLAEAYPDLKADSQFINLQRNLTETESQIAASRRAYNASVLTMNSAVQQVPSSIVASMFGFTEAAYFQRDADAGHNPDVGQRLGS